MIDTFDGFERLGNRERLLRGKTRPGRKGKRHTRQFFEELESRMLLSHGHHAHFSHEFIIRKHASTGSVGRSAIEPAAVSSPVGLTPAQIRHAYGIDQAGFGSVAGDGTGQTIAIVDAY